MSNNKQSSIEWVIYQLDRIRMLLHFGEIGVQKYNRLYEEITEKSKAMHKQEHLKTWCHSISENEPITFEEYYNKTFGDNNENN